MTIDSGQTKSRDTATSYAKINFLCLGLWKIGEEPTVLILTSKVQKRYNLSIIIPIEVIYEIQSRKT